MKGVLSLILWKSSRSNGQPASLDMASRCSTALVLPPKAMMVVMAFSKALGVMMSRGLMSRFSSSSKALQSKSIFFHSFSNLYDVNHINVAVLANARYLLAASQASSETMQRDSPHVRRLQKEGCPQSKNI